MMFHNSSLSSRYFQLTFPYICFYSRVWFLVFCTVNTIVEVGAFDSLNALVNIWLHLTRGFDSSRIDQNLFVLPGFKHFFFLLIQRLGKKIRVLRLGKTAVIAIFIIVYSFFFRLNFIGSLKCFPASSKMGKNGCGPLSFCSSFISNVLSGFFCFNASCVDHLLLETG